MGVSVCVCVCVHVCGTRCEFYVLMVGGRVFTGTGGGEGFMPYRSVSLWPPLPTPTFRETQAPAKCISQAVTIGSGNRWNICRGDRGHLCSSPAGPHLHHHLSQHCPGWGEGQAQCQPRCALPAPSRRAGAPAAWDRLLPKSHWWTWVGHLSSMGLCLLICETGGYSVHGGQFIIQQ